MVLSLVPNPAAINYNGQILRITILVIMVEQSASTTPQASSSTPQSTQSTGSTYNAATQSATAATTTPTPSTSAPTVLNNEMLAIVQALTKIQNGAQPDPALSQNAAIQNLYTLVKSGKLNQQQLLQVSAAFL